MSTHELDVGGRASKGLDLCLVDIKEAVKADAPRYSEADMPRENAQRISSAKSKGLEAPSWLWNCVVELVGSHERGYLENCRRYALESDREQGG